MWVTLTHYIRFLKLKFRRQSIKKIDITYKYVKSNFRKDISKKFIKIIRDIK